MILVQRLPTEPTILGTYRKSVGMFQCPICGGITKRDLSVGYRMKTCCQSNYPSKYKMSGESATRLGRIYKAMIRRCYLPATDSFPYYGGMGIVVCDAWKDNYLNFKEWSLSNGYSDTLELDRIDSRGNYTPENCRWVTHTTNVRNCGQTKLKEEDIPVIRSMLSSGVKVSEIAEIFNMSQDAIRHIKNGKTWKDVH